MKEKSIYRMCLDCGQTKRTTVHKEEEENYYCEECQKKTARLAYSSTKKGALISIIIAVLFFVLGWLFRGLV